MLAYKKAGYSWDSCMCVARIFLSKNILTFLGLRYSSILKDYYIRDNLGTKSMKLLTYSIGC